MNNKYRNYLYAFRDIGKRLAQIDTMIHEAEFLKRVGDVKGVAHIKKEHETWLRGLKSGLKLFIEYLDETEPNVRKSLGVNREYNPDYLLEKFELRLTLRKESGKVLRNLDKNETESLSKLQILAYDIMYHANWPYHEEITDVWEELIQKEFGPEVIMVSALNFQTIMPIEEWHGPLKKMNIDDAIAEEQKSLEETKSFNKKYPKFSDNPYIRLIRKRIEQLKRIKEHNITHVVCINPVGSIHRIETELNEIIYFYSSPLRAAEHEKLHVNFADIIPEHGIWENGLAELLTYISQPEEKTMRLLSTQFDTIQKVLDEAKKQFNSHGSILPGLMGHVIAHLVIRDVEKQGVTSAHLTNSLKEGKTPKQILLEISPQLEKLDQFIQVHIHPKK